MLVLIPVLAIAEPVGVFRFSTNTPAVCDADYVCDSAPPPAEMLKGQFVGVNVIVPILAFSNGWGAVTGAQKLNAYQAARTNAQDCAYDSSDILRASVWYICTQINSNRSVVRKAANLTPAKFPDLTPADARAGIKALLP